MRAPDFTITTDQQEFYRIPSVLMYISVSLSLSFALSFEEPIRVPLYSDTSVLAACMTRAAKSRQKLYISVKIKNFFDKKYLAI